MQISINRLRKKKKSKKILIRSNESKFLPISCSIQYNWGGGGGRRGGGEKKSPNFSRNSKELIIKSYPPSTIRYAVVFRFPLATISEALGSLFMEFH